MNKTTLKPGPLVGQDLSLLVAGRDVVLDHVSTKPVVVLEAVSDGTLRVGHLGRETYFYLHPHNATYLGIDLSAEHGAGWIGWGGGENVLGDRRVEVMLDTGDNCTDTADTFSWGRHYQRYNIIAFRLADLPSDADTPNDRAEALAEFKRRVSRHMGQADTPKAGEGKEPGQVAYEGWSQGLPGCEWANQTATQKRAWGLAAEAVLSAQSARVKELEAEVGRLNEQARLDRQAFDGVMAWDAARKYPLPYRVRDPIYARLEARKALATQSTGETG